MKAFTPTTNVAVNISTDLHCNRNIYTDLQRQVELTLTSNVKGKYTITTIVVGTFEHLYISGLCKYTHISVQRGIYTEHHYAGWVGV